MDAVAELAKILKAHWNDHSPGQVSRLRNLNALDTVAQQLAATVLALDDLLLDSSEFRRNAESTDRDDASSLREQLAAEGVEIDTSTPDPPRAPEESIREMWSEEWPRTCLTLLASGPFQLERCRLIAAMRVRMEYRDLCKAGRTPFAALHEATREVGTPPEHVRHPLDERDLDLAQKASTARAELALAERKRYAEQQVIAALGDGVLGRTARKVIAHLQQMTEERLSGDDSGLANVWDEVCAQVQHEESVYWDAYNDTMRAVIRAFVAALSKPEKQAAWLQTNRGIDWSDEIDKPDHGDEPDDVPVDIDDLVELVLQRIHNRAANWSNARIRAFLERSTTLD